MSACSPPTEHHFDVDMHDCPCGHLYGHHDYEYDAAGVMVILRCDKCPKAPEPDPSHAPEAA